MRNVNRSSPTGGMDCILAHCPRSSEWVPSGNTGEVKVVRKGTGYHTSYADGSGYASSLIGTPLCTKVHGTTYTFTGNVGTLMIEGVVPGKGQEIQLLT